METKRLIKGIERLTLVGALALGSIGLDGCVSNNCKDYRDQVNVSQTNQDQYDFSQFTRYLGNEWYRLPEEKKQETREVWKEADEEGKDFFLGIYKNPEKHYHSLDKNVRENIDAALEYQKSRKSEKQGMSEKDYQEIVDFSAKVPWINAKNFTRKDLIFLGALGEVLAAALSGH